MPFQSKQLILPPTFSTTFIAGHNVIWCGISLWSAGISCPSSVSFQLLVHHQPTHWGAVGSGKGLDAVGALLSNNKNITGLSTGAVFSTNLKCSCIPAIVRERTLSQPKSAHTYVAFGPFSIAPVEAMLPYWKYNGKRLRTNVRFSVPLTN